MRRMRGPIVVLLAACLAVPLGCASKPGAPDPGTPDPQTQPAPAIDWQLSRPPRSGKGSAEARKSYAEAGLLSITVPLFSELP